MVASTRIGESLRASRVRLGLTREALAYHSGVSWSAIAQIESGRRKDVRLSSLTALAEALGVSVDHLIGSASVFEPRLLDHRILSYGSDEDLLGFAIPFFTEGPDRSEGLLAVMPRRGIELLDDALDGRSTDVELVDSADWYRSPATALDRYRAFLRERLGAGATWIRIVGEIPLRGRSPAQIEAWTRYEAIINLVFASSPATIVCSYDTGSLPADVVGHAGAAHPAIADGSVAVENPKYRNAEDLLLGPAVADRG
jgi:transcriptional regulator with XRE-family HTH domain